MIAPYYSIVRTNGFWLVRGALAPRAGRPSSAAALTSVEAFELAVAAPRSSPRGHLASGRSIHGPHPGRPARDAAAADYTQASLGATDAVVINAKRGF